jgi:hypothetical protein
MSDEGLLTSTRALYVEELGPFFNSVALPLIAFIPRTPEIVYKKLTIPPHRLLHQPV